MNTTVLVFDLDGTLIDSRKDIAVAVNHSLVQVGLAPLSESVIASYVGDGALALLQRATGLAANEPQLLTAHTEFRQYYTRHAAVYTQVYAGVRDTLTSLQQRYTLALCTNKPRETTDQVLQDLDLAKFFKSIVAADDLPEKKPHPAPLLRIAKHLGVNPSVMAMIGDGPQDINCGHAAGTLCVGVTFGIKSRAEMLAANPHHVVDRFDDLLRLFAL